jgi:hypothetical protein
MDDMGTPGPNHPAHRGLKTPNNVVNIPMSPRTKLRHRINKIKDALFEPEQVEYEPRKNVDGALDNYMNNAIDNSGLNLRSEHFELGQQEAKIISMGKFKEDKANKELMEKNNE